jgi:hypothetical protein
VTGPSLRRIIEQEKRRSTRLENSSPFTRSGTSVTAQGETTVEGHLRLTGTLTADRVIDNSALTSPVVPAAFSNTVTAFDPVISSFATVASVTLTVPDGLTQAVVTASCYVAIVNTTPSTSTQIHSRVLIDTEAGPVDDEWSDPSRRDTGGNTYSTALTGLTPGGTFVVAAQAYAGADFTAHANNKATISGVVLWLR